MYGLDFSKGLPKGKYEKEEYKEPNQDYNDEDYSKKIPSLVANFEDYLKTTNNRRGRNYGDLERTAMVKFPSIKDLMHYPSYISSNNLRYYGSKRPYLN